MRTVLDTNVLIAAFIARGTCHELLEHCVRRHELLTSEFILDELAEKLSGKFRYPAEKVHAVQTLLRSRMVIVCPQALEAPICRGRDDDNILAAAQAAAANCIVTGDRDLLEIGTWKGIAIVDPRGFWVLEAA